MSHDSAYIADAGVGVGDPVLGCHVEGRKRGAHSIWYSYTTGADTEYVTLSTGPSELPVIVSVHEGAPGRFRMVAGGCNDEHTGTGAIRGLRLSPHTAYSIELATESGPLPSVEALGVATEPSSSLPILMDLSSKGPRRVARQWPSHGSKPARIRS